MVRSGPWGGQSPLFWEHQQLLCLLSPFLSEELLEQLHILSDLHRVEFRDLRDAAHWRLNFTVPGMVSLPCQLVRNMGHWKSRITASEWSASQERSLWLVDKWGTWSLIGWQVKNTASDQSKKTGTQPLIGQQVWNTLSYWLTSQKHTPSLVNKRGTPGIG